MLSVRSFLINAQLMAKGVLLSARVPRRLLRHHVSLEQMDLAAGYLPKMASKQNARNLQLVQMLFQQTLQFANNMERTA